MVGGGYRVEKNKGEKKWENYNSIINKTYFFKKNILATTQSPHVQNWTHNLSSLFLIHTILVNGTISFWLLETFEPSLLLFCPFPIFKQSQNSVSYSFINPSFLTSISYPYYYKLLSASSSAITSVSCHPISFYYEKR